MNQKVLLIIGFVIALVAGLIAGFTINNGQIEPRAAREFTASSTVLLTSPQPNLFQVEIPGVTQTVTEATDPAQQIVIQAATPIDLSESAILLAYMASSDVVLAEVADAVGGFEDGDAVTAVRRTTQPAGDEQFGGRLELPIIDIVGVSTSAARAELIAAEATTAFNDLIIAQQDEWGVAPEIRLTLEELNAPVAADPVGGNPAIPVIVVTVGVFLLFIALALIIEATRDRRRRAAAEGDDPDADAGDADASTSHEPATGYDEELDLADAEASYRRSVRRRSVSEVEPADDDELSTLVPQGDAQPLRS
ncbi:MAG: hypothetical protein ABWY26_11365 [Microbacterium sp.]